MLGLRIHKQASLRVAVPTSLPAHMQKHMRELISIDSEVQRQGHATGLMHNVCQEADNACMTLLVQVNPFRGGMTAEQLITWYSKFGFIEIQNDPVVMMARQVRKNVIIQ